MMGRAQKIPGGHLPLSLPAPPSWQWLRRWTPDSWRSTHTTLHHRSIVSWHQKRSAVSQSRWAIEADRSRGTSGGCISSLPNSAASYPPFTAEHGSVLLSSSWASGIFQFHPSPISNAFGPYSLRPNHALACRKFSTSAPSTTELDEDFQSEQANQASTRSCETNDQHSVSVRIKPLRAGILDRDLVRRRRTQPFSDHCWMRSLGVGLYRDKVRNWRRINTITSATPEQKKQEGESECITEIHTYTQKDSSMLKNEHDGSKHEAEGDNETEDEDEGNSQWETGRPEAHAKGVIDQGVADLESGLKGLESKTHPNDVRIGLVCLRLAQACDSADEDPEKVLSYASRALRILGSVEESVRTAACLQVIGSAYCKLQKFEKALAELEQAARMLEKLERVVGEHEIGKLKYTVQFLLGNTKIALGMDEAALGNFFESLDISERILNPGDPDLGMMYQKVADACLESGHLKEAKTMCCKGLQNYQNFFGPKSTQVAMARKLLALIYIELGEYDKALQEHEEIRPIIVNQGLSKEVVSLDSSTADVLFRLEKYKEAIPVIENVMKGAPKNSLLYISAMVSLAKSYAKLEKGIDALKWGKKTLDALSKNTSVEAAECLSHLASVYVNLNQIDEAITTHMKALAIFETNPDFKENVADNVSKIGALLLFKGKVDDAIPYLKKALGVFKEIFGVESDDDLTEPDGTKLLTLYNHLGISEIELQKYEEAVDTFEKARRLSLRLLGPDDPCTMAVYQNLVSVYPILGRYDIAIEYQKHIVESTRKAGKGALDSLKKAESKLRELTQKSSTLTKAQESN